MCIFKSTISLGKCHIALENMWVIFKYLLIFISNIIPQRYENRLCMTSIPLDHEIFCTLFYVPGYVPVSPGFTVYGNLNRICILLLCEDCINLHYAELVHGAFQFFYILLLFCIFILLIFESLILKLQLNILTYLFKKRAVIYSGAICSFVLYFPSLL